MGGRAAAILAGGGKSRAASILEEEEAPQQQVELPNDQTDPDGLERSILSSILDMAGDMSGNASGGMDTLRGARTAMGGEDPLAPVENFAEAAVGTWSPGLGRAAPGAMGALKHMGKSAATEGALGIGQGALNRMQEGSDESIDDMVMSLLGEGGIAAGADAVLGGAGKIASKVGDAASWLGRKADNVKAGGDHRTRKELIEKFGIEGGPDQLGELLRAYSPSSLFTPKTSAGHLANIERQLADEGIHHADAVRAAGAEGADAALPKVWGEAKDDILDRAADVQRTGVSKTNAQVGRDLEQAAYRLDTEIDDPAVLEQLINYKGQFADEAFSTTLAHPIEDQASARAAGEAWKSLRGAQSRAVSEASPYTEFSLNDSDRVFSDLSALQSSLTPRASADDAVGNIGSSVMSAAAGSMMNPAMGAMSALASGTNNAVRQATGGIAHDMFANVMHPTGSMLRGAGRAAEGLPTGTLTAEGAEQSRGHQLSKGVRGALQSDPSVFGQYAAELQEAEESGDLSTTVGRLIEEDPQFRALLRRFRSGG